MAHNLATFNGQVMMSYQGETPWHKLGQRMYGAVDVPTALAAANMAWTVATAPLYRLIPGAHRDGQVGGVFADAYEVVDDRRAILREDGAYLGSVGPQFTPIQNSEAFDVLSDACRDFGVTIESAGALGNGARTWMLAKLPESVDVTPGDTINGYFLIVNGHDGSQAYGARPTPIRVVCQNTLSAALSSGVDMIRIRHTKSADARLDEAKRLIVRMIGAMNETGQTFRTLAERRMTPADVATYITEILPAPADQDPSKPITDTLKARREAIARLVWAGKGAAMAGSDANGSTAWAAYNAVVEYFDHVRPAEAKSAAGAARANESAIFGSNHDLKLLALRKARALVAA